MAQPSVWRADPRPGEHRPSSSHQGARPRSRGGGALAAGWPDRSGPLPARSRRAGVALDLCGPVASRVPGPGGPIAAADGAAPEPILRGYGRTAKPAVTGRQEHRMLTGVNPATEETLAELPEDTAGTLAQKANAARRAQPAWARMPLEQRLAAVRRFSELLQSRRESLAQTLTAEVGKPIRQSRNELTAMQ